MIARHLSISSTKRSSFVRLVSYISDPQNKTERVGAINAINCYSDNIEDVIAEVSNTQRMNTRSTDVKTYHLLISFRKEEVLSDETIHAIEDSLCDSLGFGEHQRLSVVHHDTENKHIHVAINKIHPKRHTIHTPKSDFKILLKVSEELEEKYGLISDNHKVKQRGAQSGASDMEHKAGIESLVGWIQKTCLSQIKDANSWESLHDSLSTHSLQLRERGNGFVFVSKDGIAVKASSVDRDLSKNNLVKRLGPFVACEDKADTLKQGASQYRKRPTKSKPNTEKLYALYTLEQAKIISQRENLLSRVKQEKEKNIASIKYLTKQKRTLIKHSQSGLVKKLSYQIAYLAQGMQIKKEHKKYLAQRKLIYERNARLGWKQWLSEREGSQVKAAVHNKQNWTR